MIKCRGAVTVTTDAYTNTNRSSIINFMVTAPGMKSFFWSCLHTGSIQHTAEYLAAELARVVNEIQTKTGAIVTGILSDNASNMVAAWKILEAKLPVFGGGCAAHMLNLVLEEVFSKITFIVHVREQAYKISRFVRDHHGLLEEFKLLQVAMIPTNETRRALVIPVPTRWYSQHACLKSVLTNRSVLEDLFRAPRHKLLRDRYPTTEIEAVVAEVTFWNKLAYAVAMIDPIIEALGELESDDAEPSRVYERFRWLLEGYSTQPLNPPSPGVVRSRHRAFGEPIPDARGRTQRHAIPAGTRTTVRSQIKAIVKERWSLCHTDAMGIAFLLDPNTDMSLFVGTDADDSMEQACDYAERSKMLERLNITRQDFKKYLYDFGALKTEWSADKRAKNAAVRPRSWWKCNNNVDEMHRNLSYIADIVFSISTSSAASERAWSIMDYIHSKKRNCLKMEKVDMLSYIYINGGMLYGDKVDFARVQTYPESDVVDPEVTQNDR